MRAGWTAGGRHSHESAWRPSVLDVFLVVGLVVLNVYVAVWSGLPEGGHSGAGRWAGLCLQVVVALALVGVACWSSWSAPTAPRPACSPTTPASSLAEEGLREVPVKTRWRLLNQNAAHCRQAGEQVPVQPLAANSTRKPPFGQRGPFSDEEAARERAESLVGRFTERETAVLTRLAGVFAGRKAPGSSGKNPVAAGETVGNALSRKPVNGCRFSRSRSVKPRRRACWGGSTTSS
ncbi:hypothetical protein SALBM311S_12100 [Streptomyces alboniger]